MCLSSSACIYRVGLAWGSTPSTTKERGKEKRKEGGERIRVVEIILNGPSVARQTGPAHPEVRPPSSWPWKCQLFYETHRRRKPVILHTETNPEPILPQPCLQEENSVQKSREGKTGLAVVSFVSRGNQEVRNVYCYRYSKHLANSYESLGN